MKVNHGESEIQGDTGAKKHSHTLKIEAIGDFARCKVKPRIRLSGYWLERAGFKPGHRVAILLLKPGEMTLHFREATDATA